jgi:hypothetical protein
MVTMTLARNAQFLVYGVSWMLVLVSMGIYFRATRARAGTAAQGAPVVTAGATSAGRRL